MIQVTFTDPGGRARQKLMRTDRLPASFCTTVLLHARTGVNGVIAGHGAHTGHISAGLSVDAARTRKHWAPGMALAVADIVDPDGTAHPLCASGVLQAVQERLRAAGTRALVGLEIELYLIPEAILPDVYAHRVTPRTFRRDMYGSMRDGSVDRLLQAVTSAAERCEIPIESIHREYENLQYEFALAPVPPLRAADDAILFRELVRDLAAREGLVACFMPKPFTNELGNGLHINVSLQETALEVEPGTAVDLTGPWLAQVAAHFPACCAIWNPSVNSYRRLAGADLSATTSAVAVERRDTMLRIVARGGSRVEFRLPDAACNPYTGIALCLQLLGEHLPTRRPADGPGAPDRATALPPALPRSLPEALALFNQDPVVSGIFPADFVAALNAQGAQEIDFYRAVVSDVDYMLHMPGYPQVIRTGAMNTTTKGDSHAH